MANNVTMAQMDTHANWYLDLSRYKAAKRHQQLTNQTRCHNCSNMDIALSNPFISTLKPQSNGPSYSKITHWALMGWLLHLVQRGAAWAGPQPTQATHHCTKCNTPPINGQCTNFVLFDVAL